MDLPQRGHGNQLQQWKVREGRQPHANVGEFDERGKVSACAYSGCWEGRARVLRKDGGFFYAAGSYRFSTSQSKERTKVAIAIDREAGVGFVLVSSFAHPMTCKK